jgi:hypothetical protein
VASFLAEVYTPQRAGGGGPPAPVARVRAAAIAIAHRGSGLRYRLALLMPADDACFYLFDAQSAADVAAIGELAGLEFERIVEVVELVETPEA